MVYFLYQIKRGEDMNINNYMLISLNRISKKHGYTVENKGDRYGLEKQLDSLNLILDN